MLKFYFISLGLFLTFYLFFLFARILIFLTCYKAYILSPRGCLKCPSLLHDEHLFVDNILTSLLLIIFWPWVLLALVFVLPILFIMSILKDVSWKWSMRNVIQKLDILLKKRMVKKEIVLSLTHEDNSVRKFAEEVMNEDLITIK